MTKNKLSIIIIVGSLIAVIIILVLIVLFRQDEALPKEISIQKAYFDKYQTKKAVFLDVRETDEWNEYHIPNSIHISLSVLPKKIKDLPQDKEIVVVCRTGNRSRTGRDLLLNAGFSNVTSMKGGVKEWKNAGYPVVTGP